jgi:hypothetical protein
MNDVGNEYEGARGKGMRKPGRFGWLFQEWVFEILLVVAVVAAMVDGVLRLGGPSIA